MVSAYRESWTASVGYVGARGPTHRRRRQFRGGDGIVPERQALVDCDGTILSDPRVTRPYLLAGGAPAHASTNAIICGHDMERLSGKVRFALRRGDVLRLVTPGGGGFGAT